MSLLRHLRAPACSRTTSGSTPTPACASSPASMSAAATWSLPATRPRHRSSNACRRQAEAKYLQRHREKEYAGRCRHPILIRNVRVFDANSKALGEPADVYVNEGRIAAIYPAGSPAKAPATVIDGAGRALLPGLFDMHTHEDAWNAALQIAGGVTTSRDMGNDNAYLARLMADIAGGARSARTSSRPATSRARAPSPRAAASSSKASRRPRTRSTGTRSAATARSSSTTRSSRSGPGRSPPTRTHGACASVATCRRSRAPSAWCARAMTNCSTSTS